MAVVCSGALLAAGCSSAAEPSASATSPAPSTTSAAPSPSIDYAADTKKVCDEAEKIIDTDLEVFAERLGEMIIYKEADKTAQAKTAMGKAQNELKELAQRIRELTATALDPKLREAGEESAESIEATAAGNKFFDGIKTLADLDSLESEMIPWLTPLMAQCE